MGVDIIYIVVIRQDAESLWPPMTPPFYSIEKAPLHLPLWQIILDDLGRPPVHRIARTLGVSHRTVHRWNGLDQAPRMACLSLFWLTRWGISQVNTQAVNDAAVCYDLAQSLQRENKLLKSRLEHLQQIGSFSSANAPLIDNV